MQYYQWKDEHNWFEWPYERGKIIKDYPDWDFRTWALIRENVWAFRWDKKSGHNDKVEN